MADAQRRRRKPGQAAGAREATLGRTRSGDELSLGVVVPSLKAAGGAERLALQCVRRWQDRHRITLYSQGFDEELLEELGISDAVETRTLPTTLWHAVGPHPADRLIDGIVRPAAWNRALQPHDVYLAHQWPSQRIERRPLVWYAHELHRNSYDLLRNRPEGAVHNEMGRLLDHTTDLRADDRHEILHRAIRELDLGAAPDRIVANSRFTAAALGRALGRDDVEVVYPGVDLGPAPRPAPASASDDPYFLYVAAMHPHKRHRLAIEAISLVEGARLVLVGRGGFTRQLERVIARLGVEDRVEICDDVDDAELAGLYAGSRAALLTSLNEPFGMVALEALAAGRPLLAVDQGGFTEVVDSSCTIQVPPEPGALADAMRLVLARPEAAERMGEAGRKIAQQYSWERTARELEAILVDAHRAATAAAAARARPSPARRKPEIGVRLRADYGENISEGGWREFVRPVDMPRLGFYASHHEDTLRRQMAEIEACGFDFVTFSFFLDDRQLCPRGIATLRNALELAPELGRAARFAVELELNGPPTVFLEQALDWVADAVRGHDSLVEVDGRPLVLLRPDGPRRAVEHPELYVIETSERGTSGDLAVVPTDDGTPFGDALAAAAGATPAPARLLVSSWNDHPAGDALEATVHGGHARAEAMRAALAER